MEHIRQSFKWLDLSQASLCLRSYARHMNDAATATDVCTYDLGIEGMTCASCVSRVERALNKVPGVFEASVNLATESARIRFSASAEEAAELQTRLRRAVKDAGYEPRTRVDKPAPESPWAGFAPIALGLLLSAPLVLPMLGDLFGAHWMLPPWMQFALATPVQFILGARFYKGAWHALKARSANMDVLVSVGTSAGWGLSMWLWLTAPADAHGMPHHAPHLYFEASAVVVSLVMLGKWLEARAKRQTTAAIAALQALKPEVAHVVSGNEIMDVPVEDVLVGDTLAVLPGERIPADGVVSEGQTQVDESMLTGEPLPVNRGVGSKLTGGSINGAARVLMRVQAVGAQTVLARIIAMVEDAQAAKAPIQRLVDQVSAVFVPVVMGIALLTLVGWSMAGAAMDVALIHAVTVLVIACPCALGLATPVAIMAGTGVAAQHGILIQDVQALEIAHRVDTVAFDKTGTLTVGQPRLVVFEDVSQTPFALSGIEGNNPLQLAASLQAGSEHPLARAVLDSAKAQGVVLLPAQDVQAVAGRGTQGVVSGHTVRIASLTWAKELGVALDAAQPHLDRLAEQGSTVSLLLVQEPGGVVRCRAVMGFADEPKPEAKAALAALRSRGLRLVMISGDNEAAAQAMAARLGLQTDEVHANVLPGDKAAHIAALKLGGHVVAMVGDGVNDAPALAAADVGMAMGTGTDVAMHAAGITLMRGDVALVGGALDVSKRTVSKIRQNLFWAFAYNVAGIPLAALGYLNPVVAGAAMALSSVSVMSNALLLRRWKP